MKSKQKINTIKVKEVFKKGKPLSYDISATEF